MKKFNISILGVIGILILVVFASGCTSSSNNTTNSSSSNGQSSGQSSQSTSSSSNDIAVKVSYLGPWTGNINDNSGSRSVQGTGSTTFQLGKNPGVVSAVFQKNDASTNSTGTITVQIINDAGSGSILETQSTSANAGVVSVGHTF